MKFVLIPDSVSYTHLDVYKRQEYVRTLRGVFLDEVV